MMKIKLIKYRNVLILDQIVIINLNLIHLKRIPCCISVEEQNQHWDCTLNQQVYVH